MITAKRLMQFGWCLPLFAVPLQSVAQQINVGLYAMPEPDSFEMRVRATEGSHSGLMSFVATVRWETEAGGTIAENDIVSDCGAYRFIFWDGALVTHGNFTYYSFVITANAALGKACAITTVEEPIGTFRIQGLSGCRNVTMVNDVYTASVNRDYYISVGGLPMTGTITTGPISAGVCGPCVPPEILSISNSGITSCTAGPTDLAVVATGTSLLYSWSGPEWWPYALHSPDSVHLAQAVGGEYSVIVENGCGSASASTVVSTVPCTGPPVIEEMSGTFINSEDCSNGPLLLGIELTTGQGCLGYTWTGPVPVPDGSPTAFIPQGIAGAYTVVVSSACGSVTGSITMSAGSGTANCTPPVINDLVHSDFVCDGDVVTFSADVTEGSSCMSYQWYTPSAGPTQGTQELTLNASFGDHQLVVSNPCGTDTATIQLSALGCIPPSVGAILGDTLICIGEELVLEAQVGIGDCYTAEWSGPNGSITPDDPFTWVVVNEQSGTYTFTLTNGCGQASASIDIAVVTSPQQDILICDNSPNLDLNTALDNIAPNGFWMYGDAQCSNIYDPVIDSSGTYTYYDPDNATGCPSEVVQIWERPFLSAGISDSITVCSTDPPFLLFEVLDGSPDPGGHWGTGPLFGQHSSTYDPAIHQPGRISYIHFGSPCNSGPAHVWVFETAATPWYADTDGDTLGDQAVVLMDCEAPEGYVANATDECPLAYGNIGSPCDDGLSWSANDALDASCNCVGELSTGLDRGAQGKELRFWPNPNRTGQLYISGLRSIVHGASITVFDMVGKEVVRMPLTSAMSGTLAQLDLSSTATGVYQIVIATGTRTFSERLVIER